ncbi:MAG: RNA methyltransferase, partial [Chloroflexota bacterium]|nr:RNA methyltransferase [Chloroflexota bacterium]
VVSSEGHGASAGAQAGVTGRVSIPTRQVESLNVAVAGSIILFEAARQRQPNGVGSDTRSDAERKR